MTLRFSRFPGGGGFCTIGNWSAWREQFPELPEDAYDMYYDREALNKLIPLSGAKVVVTTKDEKQRTMTLALVARPTQERRMWSTVGWFVGQVPMGLSPGICGEWNDASERYTTCGKWAEIRVWECENDATGSGSVALCVPCYYNSHGIRDASVPRN